MLVVRYCLLDGLLACLLGPSVWYMIRLYGVSRATYVALGTKKKKKKQYGIQHTRGLPPQLISEGHYSDQIITRCG